jgi:hypothetical protein
MTRSVSANSGSLRFVQNISVGSHEFHVNETNVSPQPVDWSLANNGQIKVIHIDEKRAFRRSDPIGVPIRGPHVRITHTRNCLFLGSAPHTSTGDHLLVRQGFSSNQIRAWRACTRGRRVSLVSPQQHLRFRIFLVALLVALGLSISDEMWRDRTEQNSQI